MELNRVKWPYKIILKIVGWYPRICALFLPANNSRLGIIQKQKIQRLEILSNIPKYFVRSGFIACSLFWIFVKLCIFIYSGVPFHWFYEILGDSADSTDFLFPCFNFLIFSTDFGQINHFKLFWAKLFFQKMKN
jgi:hypothetical protein